MLKNKIRIFQFLLVIPLIITACTQNKVAPEISQTFTPMQGGSNNIKAQVQPTQVNSEPQAKNEVLSGENLSLEDDQGAVSVVITPLNLTQPGEMLDFEVQMNTHSVDLSMDLVSLATLSTDTGKSVSPKKWDVTTGGHHVSGTLSFPTVINNSSLLESVTSLTLVLKEIDAAERVFTWQLSSK